VDFLFQPPPIPVLPQTVKSFVDTPFQKYQLSLKRQLVCRSTQLDSVISTLEQCARAIQYDFFHLKAGGDGKTMYEYEFYYPIFEPYDFKTDHSFNDLRKLTSQLRQHYLPRLYLSWMKLP
jgi:hypothetical protein